MKTLTSTTRTIALAAALLLPGIALADHDADRDRDGIPDRKDNVFQAPPAPRSERGHYELKMVQVWVDGFHQQVFVPEVCVEKRRHGRGHGWGNRKHKVVCTPAHYEQRWVPGRYESRQEWVWVARPYAYRWE